MKTGFEMKTALSVFLLLASSVAAESPSATRMVTGNFPRDLYGAIDTRLPPDVKCNFGPCIWGYADQDAAPVHFHAPAGMRVVITSVTGNVIAAIKTMPGDPRTPPESWAGYIGGMQTTSSYQDGATLWCDLCAQGAPVNAPGIVSAAKVEDHVDFAYRGRLPLDDDNILWAKLGAFLNSTGKPIHIELTYTIQFHFEPR